MTHSFIRLFFLQIILSTSFLTFGQNNIPETSIVKPDKTRSDKIFTVAEVEPEFPGGEKEIYKYISSNLNYRAYSVSKKSRVKYIVALNIENDGTVTNPTITGDNIQNEIKDALMEVLNIMPKWSPASQNGKKVRFHYVLPLYLELER